MSVLLLSTFVTFVRCIDLEYPPVSLGGSSLGNNQASRVFSNTKEIFSSALSDALSSESGIDRSLEDNYAQYVTDFNKLDDYDIFNKQELINRYTIYLSSLQYINTLNKNIKNGNKYFSTKFLDWYETDMLNLAMTQKEFTYNTYNPMSCKMINDLSTANSFNLQINDDLYTDNSLYCPKVMMVGLCKASWYILLILIFTHKIYNVNLPICSYKYFI